MTWTHCRAQWELLSRAFLPEMDDLNMGWMNGAGGIKAEIVCRLVVPGVRTSPTVFVQRPIKLLSDQLILQNGCQCVATWVWMCVNVGVNVCQGVCQLVSTCVDVGVRLGPGRQGRSDRCMHTCHGNVGYTLS